MCNVASSFKTSVDILVDQINLSWQQIQHTFDLKYCRELIISERQRFEDLIKDYDKMLKYLDKSSQRCTPDHVLEKIHL